ncbi:MAG: hypothetical protein QME49_01845 [bacterium]|nr:hypothetical protein [bacterium]
MSSPQKKHKHLIAEYDDEGKTWEKVKGEYMLQMELLKTEGN